MLIVKGPWLPGFTDAENTPNIAAFLAQRHYDDAEGGPALFTALRNNLLGNVRIIADCVTPENQFLFDPKNQILASCIRQNCKSAVWWMVEREDTPKWSVYAGSWNETFGVLVLETSGWGSPQVSGHETPLVVISDEPDQMHMLMDLGVV